ncbi:porin family protein [Afipia massiliensis]|uniref:Porin family protein n=1 Tax=Afipia massiliensis TaxID=211460 RepID=A0A4U6BNX3_9BRAD|nr:outer membrane beta-barrel protein [Afipia massiliensis]TKT70414.1 porin family protein [Afipia massiliensis]
MRKIAVLLLAAAGVSLAGAASAADLGTAPIYRKAPPVQVFTWTGGYIGGYIGGAFGANDVVTGVPVDGAGLPIFAGAPASYGYGSSVIGGYTSGYNYQFAPNWVIGYEGETGYIGLKGSSAYAGSATSIATTRAEGLYSVWAARFGYAFDRSLIYVKGGAALVDFETGVSNGTPGTHIDTMHTKYRLGYAIGGGWEYAFDNKWSVKAEYLYMGFDNNITTTGNLNGNGGTQVWTTTSLPGIHTAKVGLNYKFDMLGYVLGIVR